jgi:Protein of unknown function (DUF3455)
MKPSRLQPNYRFNSTIALTALGLLLGMTPSSWAQAQDASAFVPTELTPPEGNIRFLTVHATGTQDYICMPSTSGANTWVFFSPQATLSLTLFGGFQQQVLTHFLSPVPEANLQPLAGCTISAEADEVNCPTWQSSFDSSAVWGEKISSVTAGADASCPNTGSIPCLLLKAAATREGSNGPGLLAKTTYIQRLNTIGGSAPAASCHVGDQALIPYEADYSFFSAKRRNKLGRAHIETEHRPSGRV